MSVIKMTKKRDTRQTWRLGYKKEKSGGGSTTNTNKYNCSLTI